MNPHQKNARKNLIVAVVLAVLAALVAALLATGDKTPERASTPAVEATPAAAPAPEPGRSEGQMRKVTPVVNAVSPGAASALNQGARVLDEAGAKQNKAVDDLFGPTASDEEKK